MFFFRSLGALVAALLMTAIFVGVGVGQTTPKPDAKKPKAQDAAATDDSGERIPWRPTLYKALQEAGASGKPVFAHFTSDWSPNCRKMQAGAFKDATVIKLISDNFIPARVTDAAAIDHYGAPQFPTFMVILPNGDSQSIIQGYHDADAFVKAIQGSIADVSKIGPLQGPKVIQRTMDKADEAFKAGQYGVAYALYKQVAESKVQFAEANRARDQMAAIEKLAEEKLGSSTKALAAKDYVRAARSLRNVKDEFEGTTRARRAWRTLAKLNHDDKARGAIRQATAEERLDQAKKDLKRQQYANALNALQDIVDEFGELPVAKEAKKQLDNLKNSPYLMRKARDQEAAAMCQRWISLANSWKKSRRPEKASEIYKRIIDTYPGTSFADEAAKEMRKLRFN